MAKILYLVHRMPYPPNKGDKVRSYHLLRYLAQRHDVYLGTFVDDPEDECHVDALRALCADVHVVRLHPRRAKMASLSGLVDGKSLTLGYYRDASMARWTDQIVQRAGLQAAIVFSSSMAQYAEALELPMLVDFVDVDSAKWSSYADHHRWPLSWLYRREGQRLLAYEREVAARASQSFFATTQEVDLFRRLAPIEGGRCEPMCNGVDSDHFEPSAARVSPFDSGERPVVFTGAMDYWPNIDAVVWFAREMLPELRRRHPAVRFHIVGRNPASAVRALADDSVRVSGTVPDVRPYLQHAAAVVAPLRLARGIQNKVLEAMAMGRPVVTTRACASAVPGPAGEGLFGTERPEEFVEALDRLLTDSGLSDATGREGRQRVIAHCSWNAHLALIDRHLERVSMSRALAA